MPAWVVQQAAENSLQDEQRAQEESAQRKARMGEKLASIRERSRLKKQKKAVCELVQHRPFLHPPPDTVANTSWRSAAALHTPQQRVARPATGWWLACWFSITHLPPDDVCRHVKSQRITEYMALQRDRNSEAGGAAGDESDAEFLILDYDSGDETTGPGKYCESSDSEAEEESEDHITKVRVRRKGWGVMCRCARQRCCLLAARWIPNSIMVPIVAY